MCLVPSARKTKSIVVLQPKIKQTEIHEPQNVRLRRTRSSSFCLSVVRDAREIREEKKLPGVSVSFDGLIEIVESLRFHRR